MVERYPKAKHGPRALQKRSKSFGRELDILLDDYRAALEELREAKSEQTVETAFNDSGSAVVRGLVYSIDAEGRIAPAIGGASALEPMFVAASPASAGGSFEIARARRMRLFLEDSGAAITIASRVWLSATAAGKVTPTRPAAGRFSIGHFAETGVRADGSIFVWVRIFPQSGGAL